MGRIVGIDFGKKRTGIAATDPLQIIVSPLQTVPSDELESFLASYLHREQVDALVIGHPSLGDEPTDSTAAIEQLADTLRKKYPTLPIHFQDERHTSSMARQALVQGGFKKKEREKKERTDELSAVFILRAYMEGH